MASRVERYSNIEQKNKMLRTDRNKEFYENVKALEVGQVIELEPVVSKNFNLKELSINEEEENIKVNEEYDNIKIVEETEKEHDINKILEKAKENRKIDKQEEKKKLRKDEYNITSSVNVNNIKQSTGLTKEKEEEMEELINTIYSNNLKQEIEEKENSLKDDNNKDLFSELMATNEEDKVNNNFGDMSGETKEYTKVTAKVGEETYLNLEINKAVQEKEELDKEKKIDNSFFTKSLEFKDDDLTEIDDEFYNIDKKSNTKLIIGILLMVIIVIGILVWAFM